MKSIKTLIIISLISFCQSALAQQEAMYSQYMFNTLAINPAYAGSRNVASATALYRSQWVGIPGAPKTSTFTFDAPVDSKNIGIGLQVYNDRIGITNTTGAFASYAYRIRLNTGTLAFGLQAGASQYLADFTSVALNTGGASDIAFSQNINKWLVDLGVGVYYNSDKFYIGLSSPQLLNNKLNNFTVQNENAFAGQEIHLFLASGYVFPLGGDMNLKSSVLLKAVQGAPIEADFDGMLWFGSAFSVGAQYRTAADVSGIVELQVTPQIRLGYSYDYSTTKLVQYNSGSHELMLRYEFGYSKGKILSPRYF